MKGAVMKRTTIFAVLLTMILAMFSTNNTIAAQNDNSNFEKIDNYVNSKMEELRIKGAAIGIVQNGEVVYSKGYGASNDNNEKVTPETPFILGSTTKSITALAVMQLVEAGKVKLDDPVQKYIPEFHLSDTPKSEITVRHLLNQVSGLPQNAGNSDYLNEKSTVEDFVKALYSVKPINTPGKEYQYAEANFVVLGVLISRVTGTSYENYIQENIFEPMDMKHSFTSKEEAKANGLAQGYLTCFGYPVKVDLPYPKQYVSASYMISSASDISNYLKTLLNGGVYNNKAVISKDGVQALFTPGPKLLHPEGYSYGMGWFVSDNCIIHDGRPTNYYSCLVIDPKNKTGVVLLTNTNNRLVTAEYLMPTAMEISSRVSGGKAQEGSSGFRSLYLYYNLLVLIVIMALLLRFIMTLTRFRKKSKRKSFIGVVPDIIALSVFAGTFIYLVSFYNKVPVTIAFIGQPDMVSIFITAILLSFINVIARTIIIIRKRSKWS